MINYCVNCGRKLHGLTVNHGFDLCPSCRRNYCIDCGIDISLNRKRCLSCYHKNMIGNANPFFGKHHTDKTKSTIGAKNKGKTPWLGKHHKPETKIKIGQREYPLEKNPFYGKSLEQIWAKKFGDDKAREMIVEMYKSRDYTGEKNPFFGKKHKEESKKSVSNKNKGRLSGEKNPFYGKRHPLDLQERINQKLRENAQKPEVKEWYRQNALNILARGKIRKTIPEKMVEQWLLENGINYKYSFILARKYQYDFIVPHLKYLIEVNGDYWHANPEFYGANKKSLN
ncbi:MAG: NUMOD3 domain-containing DNA-binding protein, partial [Nanoarchaeota archaeon]